MSDNPWEESNPLTITIKAGKDFSDSWFVFRGTGAKVRGEVIDFFGIDPTEVDGWTLHDVVVRATDIAHGTNSAVKGLGGKVKSSGKKAAETPVEAGKAEPAEEPKSPIFQMIENATTVEDLKRTWAENQIAFADPEVMAAWKARGKALQSAGAA